MLVLCTFIAAGTVLVPSSLSAALIFRGMTLRRLCSERSADRATVSA